MSEITHQIQQAPPHPRGIHFPLPRAYPHDEKGRPLPLGHLPLLATAFITTAFTGIGIAWGVATDRIHMPIPPSLGNGNSPSGPVFEPTKLPPTPTIAPTSTPTSRAVLVNTPVPSATPNATPDIRPTAVATAVPIDTPTAVIQGTPVPTGSERIKNLSIVKQIKQSIHENNADGQATIPIDGAKFIAKGSFTVDVSDYIAKPGQAADGITQNGISITNGDSEIRVFFENGNWRFAEYKNGKQISKKPVANMGTLPGFTAYAIALDPESKTVSVTTLNSQGKPRTVGPDTINFTNSFFSSGDVITVNSLLESRGSDNVDVTIATKPGQEGNVDFSSPQVSSSPTPKGQNPVTEKTQVPPITDAIKQLEQAILKNNANSAVTYYNLDLLHRQNAGAVGFNTVHGSFWTLDPNNNLARFEGTSTATANEYGLVTAVSPVELGKDGNLYQTYTFQTDEQGKHTAQVRINMSNTYVLVRNFRPTTQYNASTGQNETTNFQGPYYAGKGVHSQLISAGQGIAIALQIDPQHVFAPDLHNVDSSKVLDYTGGFITVFD